MFHKTLIKTKSIKKVHFYLFICFNVDLFIYLFFVFFLTLLLIASSIKMPFVLLPFQRQYQLLQKDTSNLSDFEVNVLTWDS